MTFGKGKTDQNLEASKFYVTVELAVRALPMAHPNNYFTA
jgi:hypothetical protein